MAASFSITTFSFLFPRYCNGFPHIFLLFLSHSCGSNSLVLQKSWASRKTSYIRHQQFLSVGEQQEPAGGLLAMDLFKCASETAMKHERFYDRNFADFLMRI